MNVKGGLHEESSANAGRRTLLKTIAVAGGAAAATTILPGTWVKPAVELGVLPAEAAGPSTVPPPAGPANLILSGASIQNVNRSNFTLFVKKAVCPSVPRFVVNGTADGYYAVCDYNDPLGEFDPETWTLYTREEPCGIVKSALLCGDGVDVNPKPLNGFTGNFSFYKLIECNISTGLSWWVTKGVRSSNIVSQAPDSG